MKWIAIALMILGLIGFVAALQPQAAPVQAVPVQTIPAQPQPNTDLQKQIDQLQQELRQHEYYQGYNNMQRRQLDGMPQTGTRP